MEPRFNDLMVDLETLSTENNAAILSIGAVYFDIKTGDIGTKFYVNIDLQSCLDVGLEISGTTVEWWLNQDPKAIDALLSDKHNIHNALYMFRAFFEPGAYIWGNSARFDLGILANAYAAIGTKIPWSFRNERCFRTFSGLMPSVRNSMQFEGTKHNAIDDCINQIRVATEIYNKLKLETYE